MSSSAFRTFRFRSADVHYLREGEGPPLMFLHNGGTSHTIWRHFIARFRQSHDVIALDLPGYGASTTPERGYPLSAYVELIADVVSALRLASPTLIGNCMGSAMALLYAAQARDQVRSLVLFNPLSASTFRAGTLGGLQTIEQYLPGRLDGLASLVSRITDRVPTKALAMTLAAQLGSAGRKAGLDADEALQACYRRPGQVLALRQLLAEMDAFRAVDELMPGAMLPPLFTIWGRDNRVLSARAGRELNTRLNPVRAEELADCGHLPMLEKPELCVSLVEAFLNAHGPS